MVSLSLVACLLAAGPTADGDRSVTLTVAEELVADLVPVERGSYSGRELPALFADLRRRSYDYCRMRHERMPFDAAVAALMIEQKRLPVYQEGCFGCRWDIMAGCWNFYQLNDIAPDTDFELVKKLYPAEAYDCYAVGFLQPYIMHNVLNCRSLTMVDFDWRIHDAHFQLLDRYDAGAFKRGQLEEALAPITLGWVARTGRRGKHELSANLSWLCKQEQRRECAEHLLRFAETRAQLDRVALNLASLHDTTLTTVDAQVPRVFYLSNALDPIYMSRQQIDELLGRIRDGMADNQRAVLVYHAGGKAAFGLYELHKTPSGHVVTTACRDPYPQPGDDDEEDDDASESTEEYEGEDKEDTRGTYRTALDRRTKTRGPPSCADLLAQKRDPKPRTPPASGATLVAHWTLDDHANNQIGDGANGTVVGGTRYIDGAVGRALGFDGRDAGVRIDSDDLFDGWEAVTIAAWVRPLRGGGSKWTALIEKAGGRQQHVLWAGTKRKGGHWAVQVATDRGEARFRSFRIPVPYGEWSHVAIVVDLSGNTTRLFVNGELARERPLEVRGTALHTNTGGKVALGQITRKKEHTWRGGLDDVRVYRGALSMDAIAALAER
jgi:hypothetical protein